MSIPPRQNKRPTIGLLCNELSTEFIAQVVWGAVDAAQEAGANLLCFASGTLRDAQGRTLLSNVLYDLVSRENVDGLVVMSNFLGTFVSQDELISRVFDPYQPLPIISLGLIAGDYPAIMVDNYTGMYAAVEHLIEEHGYQRIAFVRGPLGHAEANIRFQAYQDVLGRHNLPYDPALVVVGDFLPLSGEEAIATLLDERQVSCQAIVAANDQMAFGVLKALKERQRRVPRDVAVVGFDDIDSARYTLPPLTTVRQPLQAIGQSAVNKLLSMISGAEKPQPMNLPAELVVRQSCGCAIPAVARTMMGLAHLAGPRQHTLDRRHRQTVLVAMQHTLGQETQATESIWLNQLLDTFLADLEAGPPGSFLAVLDEILRETIETGGSPMLWSNVLSTLRRSLFPLLPEDQILRAEDRWLPAQMMIYEMAQQSQHHHTSQLAQQMRRMTELQAALITTFDLQQIVDILAHELPRLGIPSCSLCLYEDPALPATTSRSLLVYREKDQRLALPADRQIFPSRNLAPAGYFPNHPYCIVVEPLHFGDEQLGLALFEVGPRQGNIYETLRGNISSSLQAALLIQRVREHSAELTRQQNILSTFMENVPDHIYFKDLQSRITRANLAHANHLNLSDPTEEIGKSDFDFFPAEQARVKYEQEQTIIRTGRPSLNAEELDESGRWTLTTKMPLRDEHGQIIGTFGIARDITELKQTQAALERAYAEVEQQIQERTVTLQHEITERRRAETQLERALRETRMRFEVSHALAEAETEDNVLDVLLQQAELYPQAFVSIFTFEKRDSELVAILRRQNLHESGLKAVFPLGTTLPASRYALFNNLSSRQIFVSADVRVDERIDLARREVLEQTGAISYAAIPLMVGNERLGYIGAMARPVNYFDEEKQHLYLTLAEQGAVALRAARLREAIRESQQRLALLVQQSPLAVIEWNTSFEVVSWNSAAERIFGYTRDEALGRHAIGLIVPEQARSSIDRVWQALLTQQGGIYSTNENLTKDGRSIICEWFNAPLVNAGGRVIGVVSLVQDVSERRRAEQLVTLRLSLLEFAATHSLEELLQKTLDEVETFTNSTIGFYHFVETDQQTLSLQAWSTRTLSEFCQAEGTGLHYPIDQAGVWTDCVRERRPVIHNDYSSLPHLKGLPEGHAQVLRELVAPIFRGDRIVAILGVGNKAQGYTAKDVEAVSYIADVAWEIAEHKRAEAEREKLIAELEAKNAELERFTYTVSHDLKSPLITMRGFLGFLEKDAQAGNAEQMRADMQRIVEATDKMQRLLSELLELSRIGRIVNPAEAVPFEMIAREAVKLVQGQLDQHQVRVELATDLPVVYGDHVRLVEVVQNLLDNACKFMGDQVEPRITIGSAGIARDGSSIVFVRDNGIGIDARYHAQVFGLFDKLDPRSEGTGIGLALVKRIVEIHGGRIWVESVPGAGATFYFTLPVKYAAEA